MAEPTPGRTPSLDLDAIRADLAELGDVNYCPAYLYQAVRHVQRNCEIECGEHGYDDESNCVEPGRYDGTAMARLLAAVPALLAAVESAHARCPDHGDRLPCGECRGF